jgi:hypothetical protein
MIILFAWSTSFDEYDKNLLDDEAVLIYFEQIFEDV